ncbi:cell division protein ZapA [uncultured Capnocytophaga sp.]|jgi:hypothetical protein|uniref:cell division protein ZapA n=1 Tax=uncultured Capnocytophaga sp. TaxID=159273 RepID=UPI00262FD8AE|nr:cell division protein ZapA [uncultured Capnocytophaga sp.]
MEQDELKIKLSVADRLYPLTIVPAQEEGFRKAAKRINEMIQEFESVYQLRDKQDGLAMCAITLARQIEQSRLNEIHSDETLKKTLQKVYNSLNQIG